MSRLRAGELIAGVGAAGLFILMFFNWFGVDQDALMRHPESGGSGKTVFFDVSAPIHVSADGWSSLGWFMVVLVCLQVLGGAALVYMTVKRASPAWPVGAGVLTWILGSLIWLVLLVRVCIAQPGPDEVIAVLAPAYLGLLFSALIPVGGLLSIKDERTTAPESLSYTPPPARTAPGTS